MNVKQKIGIGAAVAAVFALGLVAGRVSEGRLLMSKGNTWREVRQGGYKYINPLLECEPEGVSRGYELKDLERQLSSYIGERSESGEVSHVSVYFRDLNNGPWFGIGERENFSPASLLKVPLMIAYLKYAERDPGVLSKEIEYTQPNMLNVQQNIPPDERMRQGNKYTVDELLRRMIVYSDNDAQGLLFENMDAEWLRVVYRDLGIEFPTPDRPEDFMNISSYASFFRILFNASYLSKDMSEKAMALLNRTRFSQGIVAGVPSSVPVAHKFGERGMANTNTVQLHDCGVVYHPGRPYLVCIMTRGKDIRTLETVIQSVSKRVYQEISKLYPE